MKLQAHCESTVGRRSENQDSTWAEVFARPAGCIRALAVVADGMGGTLGGARASREAVDHLRERVRRQPPAETDIQIWIADRFGEIHERLEALSRTDTTLRGLGTTLVVAAVTERELIVAHVGDSRAYLVTPDEVSQLTRDHTAVQDAIDRGLYEAAEVGSRPEVRAMASALTRHLGEGGRPNPDITRLPLPQPGAVLVCSDGLSGSLVEGIVTPDQLHAQLVGTRSLRVALANLLSVAYQAGSGDNISAAAIEMGALPRVKRPLPPAPAIESLLHGEASRDRAKRAHAGRRPAVLALGALLVSALAVLIWTLVQRPGPAPFLAAPLSGAPSMPATSDTVAVEPARRDRQGYKPGPENAAPNASADHGTGRVNASGAAARPATRTLLVQWENGSGRAWAKQPMALGREDALHFVVQSADQAKTKLYLKYASASGGFSLRSIATPQPLGAVAVPLRDFDLTVGETYRFALRAEAGGREVTSEIREVQIASPGQGKPHEQEPGR